MFRRLLLWQYKQFGLLLESQEFLLRLAFKPIDFFPSLFQSLVEALHKLVVLFLADRLRHRPSLETLLELWLFLHLLLSQHFLQSMIPDAINLRLGEFVLIKQSLLLWLSRKVLIRFDFMYGVDFLCCRMESLLYGIVSEAFDWEEEKELIQIYKLWCVIFDVVDCVFERDLHFVVAFRPDHCIHALLN